MLRLYQRTIPLNRAQYLVSHLVYIVDYAFDEALFLLDSNQRSHRHTHDVRVEPRAISRLAKQFQMRCALLNT